MSFVISKLFWLFFSPSSLLILLLVLGAFLSVAQRDPWRRIGRRLCFAMAMAFFLIAILPVGEWMMVPLENRFPPAKLDHVDGIILVGEDENPEVAVVRNGQAASVFAASDYITFAALAREYPQAKLVYTGGSGEMVPDSQPSNAAVARQAMEMIGIPVNRVLFEDKSRTTYENAVDSSALVHPTKQQKWLLVTSAMHMPRSMAVFRKAGWDVYPAPTGYTTDGTFSTKLRFSFDMHLLQVRLAVHEYVGLVAYKLQGYTDEIWPK